MKAIHGGKPKNERIDALKIATRLRGGMIPQVQPSNGRSHLLVQPQETPVRRLIVKARIEQQGFDLD